MNLGVDEVQNEVGPCKGVEESSSNMIVTNQARRRQGYLAGRGVVLA